MEGFWGEGSGCLPVGIRCFISPVLIILRGRQRPHLAFLNKRARLLPASPGCISRVCLG